MRPRVIAAMPLLASLLSLGGCQQNQTPTRVAKLPATESAGAAEEPVEAETKPVAVRPELPARGVAGIVTDEAGAPVEGARVCAWTKRPPVEVTREEMLTPICADVGPDDRGGYVLSLDAGVWRLVASAPKREPAQVEVVLREASPNQVVDHALALGGRRFAGRVVDNLGRPVAGARVTANMGVPPRDRGFVQTFTGADGRFELWARHAAWLWVHAPGAAQDRHLEDGDDLVLIPESGVRGRVVDAAGQGVAGARVALRDEFSLYGDREDAARSDAQGRFELLGALPGKREVLALSADGHGVAEVDLDYAAILDGVVVRLEPWPVLHLRVVEPGVGPVAMCAIDLGRPRFWTDEEGRIDVPLKPDRYRVAEINCANRIGTPPEGVLDLRRGDASADIEVHAGHTLRGRALRPDGGPIANEELWLRPPIRSEGRSSRFDHIDPEPVVTDAEGRFEFTGLLPGTYRVNGVEWMTWKDDPMPQVRVADTPLTEVEIELPASGRVEVHSSRARWDQYARINLCEPRSSWSGDLRSDGRGVAVFEHVPLGEVVIQMDETPRCSDQDVTRLQIEAGSDHRVELAAAEPKTQTILVHVEGPDGAPVHGALVQLDGDASHSIVREQWAWIGVDELAMTDASGVARIEIAAGKRPVSIEALAPGLAVRYGEAEAAPDFDHGDDDETYEEWPGLTGTEFRVKLAPTKAQP